MNNLEFINFNELEPDELADYIVNKHHTYARTMLLFINNHILAALNSSEKFSGLKEIADVFKSFREELEQHMRKEEHILFPFIRKMLQIKRKATAEPFIQVSLVENPLRIIRKEHDVLTSRLNELEKLTAEFVCPPNGPAALRLSFAEIKEFRKDFNTHISLENNILFPKMLRLEQLLKGKEAGVSTARKGGYE